MDEKEKTTIENTEETSSKNDALKSFLDRDVDDRYSEPEQSQNKKSKKLSKNSWLIIVGIAIVAIIVAAVVSLLLFEEESKPKEFDEGTNISTTVDGKGEHQVSLVLDDKGELKNNSYGELLTYTPSDIDKMEIKNESGSYTILAKTEKTTDKDTGEEKTEATVYTLVGYEDVDLQSGGPDTIANDCCAVTFKSVADIDGKKSKDFGFDSPRATVKTTFTDGTSATIIVGDVAPNKSGSYIMFGTNKTIYLVDDEEIDGLLFSVLDLMPLVVNDSATSTDNSMFKSITLSGSAFPQTIELRPNEDSAIDTSNIMVAPQQMFVSESESANISGAIRGLYAQEAVCINPDNSQLSKYGLSNPYVKLCAVYPDTTVNIRASKPKNDFVYLISDSNVIYKVTESYVPWVNTSLEKLLPDTVIDPNFDSLSKIEITDTSGTYLFDIQDVQTQSGDTESTSSKTALYKGKELDPESYLVFFHNIGNMKKAGKATSNGSGTPVLTVKLSYSTGRATDTIKVYPTSSSKYIAEFNNQTLCLVYKSYCTKFEKCIQDFINGKTVSSF